MPEVRFTAEQVIQHPTTVTFEREQRVDPEQIYQEVLQEEQQKGSAAPVAEGRAKAARQRAAQGSPHPKEAKWWPGAQPHLEGGDGESGSTAEAEPAAEAEAEPEPQPEPEPAAPEEPAPAEPAQAPAAAAAPSDAAAAQAPAEAGGPAALPDQAPQGAPPPAAQDPQLQPAAVAAAPAPAPAPMGVRHGTPTGNRLRPEDGVATSAQFEGQQAMYDRRKLIDDLVASGVPAVSAQDAGRPGGVMLAALYVIIPILAIIILVGQGDGNGGGTEHAGAETGSEAPAEGGDEAGGGGGEGGGAGGPITVVADNVAFDTDEIRVTAASDVTINFDNQDTLEHNISVYEDQATGLSFEDAIFEGEIIDGDESVVYNFTAPDAGEYWFQCDVHPNMNGAFLSE